MSDLDRIIERMQERTAREERVRQNGLRQTARDGKTCPSCAGQGYINAAASSAGRFGQPANPRCSQCDGIGKIPR